jgi:serine/threonine-protein kinase
MGAERGDAVSDETPARGEFPLGEHVAGYRLDQIIGRGGMAVVYRAYDERLGRSVALKVLAPRLARDEAFRQRFIRESRVAAAVDHPNIIPIYEAGESSGVLFIAMRFVHGRDVLSILEQQGALPVDRACRIVTQVAAALDAAHQQGLVHRDVKPANMLRDDAAGVDQADHVYLSDFGLSKRWLSGSRLTSHGEFLGTLDYVSPEQVEGRPVDGRSDQYALACSAFEMIGGAPPFSQDEPMAIMWAQVSAPPPSLTSHRPGLPAAVDQVFAKALAKAPDDRYGSCLEFAAALRRACAAGPAPAAPPGPVRPPTQAVSRDDLERGLVPAADTDPPQGDHGPPAGQPPADQYPAEYPAGQDPAGQPPADQAAASVPPESRPPTQGIALPPVPSDPGRPAYPPRGSRAPTQGGSVPPGPGQPPPGHGLPPPGPGQPPPGHGQPPYPGYGSPAGKPPRRSRRARTTVLVACFALLGAAGAGGYALFGGGKSAATIELPGCTTKTASAKTLPNLHGHVVQTSGKPFDVAVASHDYVFVSLNNALAVMKIDGSTLRLVRTISMDEALGEALTHDGKYLLVTGGSGLTVFRVSDLETGLSSPVGTLTSPSGRHAIQVAVSPDDRFAFVTLQFSGHLAVFNLHKALTSGFGPSDFEGQIQIGDQPIGVTVSSDGRYIYVANGLATPASESGTGALTVIDLQKATTNPASAVLKSVSAGCGPDRVTVAPDGQTVWVTAGGGNALLAYSAPKLLSDPGHALLARVAVGQLPLGLEFVNDGTRIIVADSNRDGIDGGVANLAVIDPQKALAGQPSLLGVIKSSGVPRQFALEPGGKTLLIANTGNGKVQALKLTHLP